MTGSSPVDRQVTAAFFTSLHRKPMKRGKPSTAGAWALTRLLLVARSKGMCERCGGTLCGNRDLAAHHRQRRRDGNHSASNGILLGRACHEYAHGNPAHAREFGWIVSSYSDPAVTPVLLGENWVYLLDDGTTSPALPCT